MAETEAEGARGVGRGSRRRNVGSPRAWRRRELGRRGCGSQGQIWREREKFRGKGVCDRGEVGGCGYMAEIG